MVCIGCQLARSMCAATRLNPDLPNHGGEGGRGRSSDGATPVASQPVHLLMRTDDEAEEEQPLPPYFIDFVSSLQSHPQVQMSISNIYTKRCEEISHSNS